MKIISAAEMMRLDKTSPVVPAVLMERAGRGVADYISAHLPFMPVYIICGGGNNAGDGFVAARYLHERGYQVHVLMMTVVEKLSSLSAEQFKKLHMKVEILDPEELSLFLDSPAIVVDCMMGTGFKAPLRDEYKKTIEIINKKSRITVACDIPSGVNGDTGESDPCAIDADITLTFAYPKIGHLKSPGSEFSGSLEVIDIGLGIEADEYLEDAEVTVRQDCFEYFKRRSKKSHKKNYGHVLLIGGSPGMEGALAMAAIAAQRSGAGLVTCAAARSIADVISSYSMSYMVKVLEDVQSGVLGPSNASEIIGFIKERSVDAVVLGPGMTSANRPAELVKELCAKLDVPMVLDADALNVLGSSAAAVLKQCSTSFLITPHVGEMSRMTGMATAEINSDRSAAVRDLAVKAETTVILKGHRTVISDGKELYINSSANPGMATGGSGDVLTGIAAALIAQGMEIFKAARIAVWVHGRAGDLASWDIGSRPLIAEDILDNIGRV